MPVIGGQSHSIDFLIRIWFTFTSTKSPEAVIAQHKWHVWPGKALQPPAHFSCPRPCGVHAQRDRAPYVMFCFFFAFGSFKDFTLFSVVIEVRSYCSDSSWKMVYPWRKKMEVISFQAPWALGRLLWLRRNDSQEKIASKWVHILNFMPDGHSLRSGFSFCDSSNAPLNLLQWFCYSLLERQQGTEEKTAGNWFLFCHFFWMRL